MWGSLQLYITPLLQVKEKVNALRTIGSKLQEIHTYMDMVAEQKIPMNQNIMYGFHPFFSVQFEHYTQYRYIVQDIFNTLPSLHGIRNSAALASEANDQTMLTYLGVLLRSVLGLHNLILNKFEMKKLKEEEEEAVRAKLEKLAKEKEEKEKEEKEKEEKKAEEGDKPKE